MNMPDRDFAWKTIPANEYLRLRQSLHELDAILSSAQWTLADLQLAGRLVTYGLTKPEPGEDSRFNQPA